MANGAYEKKKATVTVGLEGSPEGPRGDTLGHGIGRQNQTMMCKVPHPA